jgi:hypothetical protein
MDSVERLAPEGFIKALRVNPDDLPDLDVFSGYLGESGREGYVRLYRNPALSAFLEIPVAEIKHTERLGSTADRLSSTVVWVRAGAQVDVVTVRPTAPRRTTPIRRRTNRQTRR